MLDSLKNNSTLMKDLSRVEMLMMQSVASRHDNVQKMLSDMIASGGKKLRPIFLLLGAGFGTEKTEEVYEAAAALEMIHMATLIHDDIIDEAMLRRGRGTAQSRFGKDYAVFMGDFLLNRSYILLNGKVCVPDVLAAMEKIFYGEMLQYNLRYIQHKSVVKSIRIAANKTASLFALSFYLGAKLSGCGDELCKILQKTGLYFGMSFQIMDDLLDFTSQEKILGKDVQNDIKMGVYTLPLIYAAKSESTIWKLIAEGDFDELQQRVAASGGLDKTILLAKRYAEKAIRQIKLLPDSVEKNIISELVKHLEQSLEEAAERSAGIC